MKKNSINSKKWLTSYEPPCYSERVNEIQELTNKDKKYLDIVMLLGYSVCINE